MYILIAFDGNTYSFAIHRPYPWLRCQVIRLVYYLWTRTKVTGKWFEMISSADLISRHARRFIGFVKRKIAGRIFTLIWTSIIYANQKILKFNGFAIFSRIAWSTKQPRSRKYTTKKFVKQNSHQRFSQVCRWFVKFVRAVFQNH